MKPCLGSRPITPIRSTGRFFRKLQEDVNPRSATQAWVEGTDTLVLHVEAQDLAALRAALNMFLRLVSVADEMQQIA